MLEKFLGASVLGSKGFAWIFRMLRIGYILALELLVGIYTGRTSVIQLPYMTALVFMNEQRVASYVREEN